MLSLLFISAAVPAAYAVWPFSKKEKSVTETKVTPTVYPAAVSKTQTTEVKTTSGKSWRNLWGLLKPRSK